ncbi:hypothetical protein HOO54_18780 [Bacillus sp. WMMC1349]|uniref:hypothetical protein n=1 Tax=Bacillus sp. WMMC1349 TaxID=2736254 RepID=UPI0015549193|nr:hypothetical protein [Bacillus sp. WMMC1349]NPC94209.1 hypothetical protein [Bacillus sp. WMMC1349]
MLFNIYTFLFLILAIASHLIAIFIFNQGIVAYILAILFLLAAGYSTKFSKTKD